MTLDDLISLTRARLAHLNGRMASAVSVGDAAAMTVLESEIAGTESTLAALLTLPS
jgi:hypothetical protein